LKLLEINTEKFIYSIDQFFVPYGVAFGAPFLDYSYKHIIFKTFNYIEELCNNMKIQVVGKIKNEFNEF